MDRSELIRGTLFDIQGFSVHDGPGCRTLIFLKGCSLRCSWCSNPEGIASVQEPLYQQSKCTFDLLCMKSCKYGAITPVGKPEPSDKSMASEQFGTAGIGRVSPDGTILPFNHVSAGELKDDTVSQQGLAFDRSLCSRCATRDCIAACCTGALKLGGYEMTVDELFDRIGRDRPYWGDRGGITLTGGEPFAQPLFVAQFLERCYDAFIHTAVETCGNIPWNSLEPALPFLDWIFFDLKHIDPDRHHAYTGSTNHLILHNALQLAARFNGRLVFRLPVIPGFNDDRENIEQTAAFLHKTGRKEINILPLHHLGREKYSLSGRSYGAGIFGIPSKEDLGQIREIFTAQGINCYVGSETPF